MRESTVKNKTVLYILRTRSEVNEIFNYHRQNKDAHKSYSTSERWVEFKDNYKVWYKTLEEIKSCHGCSIKGMNFDEIFCADELRNTDIQHETLVPALNRSKTSTIVWI